MRQVSSLLVIIVALIQGLKCSSESYLHKAMHEVSESELYLSYTQHSEFIVTSSSKGLQLVTNDYLTHADSYRLLSGGLAEFLKSGEEEVVVPVVDTEDVQNDGHKLLGFVLIKPIQPRKLMFRRGDVNWNLAEGGLAPSLRDGNVVITAEGAFSSTGVPFTTPPEGGGKCITAKDCYNYNGTCSNGLCSCLPLYTGTYCQLHRPEMSEINRRVREAQRNAFINEVKGSDSIPMDKGKAGGGPNVVFTRGGAKNAAASSSADISPGSKGNPPSEAAASAAVPAAATASVNKPPPKAAPEPSLEEQHQEGDNDAANTSSESRPKKKMKPGAKKRKPKPGPEADDAADGSSEEGSEHRKRNSRMDGQQNQAEEKRRLQSKHEEEQRQMQEQQQEQKPPDAPNLEDLYGPGKDYPEPYLAGKVPNAVAYSRFESRTKGMKFTYSVRFRSGPFGISFDNKLQDGSLVEKVVQGQAAQLSDIQVGDYLIAIDYYNMTKAPAKVTQRMLQSRPFPVILVFEARGMAVDPQLLAEEIKRRTLNVTILYPPTLASEFQIRLAEWAPMLSVTEQHLCPIYYLKTSSDQFGCSLRPEEYKFSADVQTIIDKNGVVDVEIEEKSPMLAMMLREGQKRGLRMPVKSVSVSKRGLCTFVERASQLAHAGAAMGIVTNTEDILSDMPQGKEKVSECTASTGIVKESDGTLFHMAGMTNEIIAVISDSRTPPTSMCARTIALGEDIVDQWPHSVPHVSATTVLATTARTRKRGMSDEGGRIALSGENGWAFFDYHLAMFGPPIVPLGAIRFIMANPPHGCDPNTYTVRVSGAAVGILRGGGCSFGIKAINAQKLGAKAVVFLNTDDKATMRLMALPDEMPLINIPCVMVSRRLQYYVDEKLTPFYQMSQHLISFQPTGIFGEYEERNKVELPQRLPGH